jgi:hypothetical protein
MPGEDARRLTGDIIEESLADRSVLSEVTILETRVEPATEYHRTPWLERWTIGSPYPRSEPRRWPNASVKPSTWSTRTAWYADFKNGDIHYVAFTGRVFRGPCHSEGRYAEVVEYSVRLGIPPHQLDFSPTIERWER